MKTEIKLLSGALGAEIVGIDLTDISDENFKKINNLLLEHKVIFFRNQDITAEEQLAFLNKLHGLRYMTVVPHNVIGIGQRYMDPYRNVVAIMINRMKQGKPIVIYGDGTQKRSFGYVEDALLQI